MAVVSKFGGNGTAAVVGAAAVLAGLVLFARSGKR
jgi:hypothetical protein